MKKMHNKTKLYLAALGGMLLLSSDANAMLKLVGRLFNKGLDAGQGLLSNIPADKILDGVGKGAKWVADTTSEIAIGIRDKYDEAAKARKEQLEKDYRDQLDTLEKQMKDRNLTEASREQARADFNRVLGEKQKKIEELNTWASEMAKRGANTIQTALDNGLGVITNKLNESIKTAQLVAVEKERGNSMVRVVENTLNWAKQNPYVVVGIPAAIFASWFILKHGSQIVADRYRVPTLFQETSLISPTEKLRNLMFGIKPDSDLTAVKLSPELSQQLAESAIGLKNMIANGSTLQNKLFYGPPGTGKTEYVIRLARDSGMDYGYFSSARLEQFSIEEATRVVSEAFTRAMHNDKPILFAVDEAELCFADRSKLFAGGSSILNDKRLAINNLFLTYMSKGSRHYMVVGITNYPNQLDAAFLSRCDEKIFIGAPNAQIRREILDHFIDKRLVRGDHLDIGENLSLFRKFTRFVFPSMRVPEKVKIAPNALSEEARAHLASRLDGWVGRSIDQLVTSIEAGARATQNNTVTAEVIKKALDRTIRQREEEANGFVFRT